jgi:hypothetical protein
MLQLNAEQTVALQAIKRERDLRALGRALAEAFPDVAARAGERFASLVEHGVQRGEGFGLAHNVCIARYLSCWFVLGADFESRPEYAWARPLLADSARDEGRKVFQLCKRVGEVLANPAPGQPAAADFAAAMARLDAVLMPLARFGSLVPAPRLQLGQACDLDAMEVLSAGPALQHYRLEQGQWLRTASPPPDALVLTPGAAVPPQLHLLAPPLGAAEPARLRLRTRASHRCDEATHPLLGFADSAMTREWRGRDAEEIRVALSAEPEPEGIAAQGSSTYARLRAASCGMRDSGPAFGAQDLTIAIQPASQQLFQWRREPSAAAASRVRHERDGVALGAERWQAGLADLDRQLEAGLARLAAAWERESGVTQGHLDAESALLTGTAGITWGWMPGRTLDQPPVYRVAGQLDVIACRLELRFTGTLQLHGSDSRLTLHCLTNESLKTAFETGPESADPRATMERVQIKFRQPFVLHVDSLATDHPSALLDQAAPLSGALAGASGLRPRPDGCGFEWFCELAVEPVSACFVVTDPTLGTTSMVRPLLPALKLVQWSLR